MFSNRSFYFKPKFSIFLFISRVFCDLLCITEWRGSQKTALIKKNRKPLRVTIWTYFSWWLWICLPSERKYRGKPIDNFKVKQDVFIKYQNAVKPNWQTDSCSGGSVQWREKKLMEWAKVRGLQEAWWSVSEYRGVSAMNSYCYQGAVWGSEMTGLGVV